MAVQWLRPTRIVDEIVSRLEARRDRHAMGHGETLSLRARTARRLACPCLLKVPVHVDDEVDGAAGLVDMDDDIAGGPERNDRVVGAGLARPPVHGRDE